MVLVACDQWGGNGRTRGEGVRSRGRDRATGVVGLGVVRSPPLSLMENPTKMDD